MREHESQQVHVLLDSHRQTLTSLTEIRVEINHCISSQPKGKFLSQCSCINPPPAMLLLGIRFRGHQHPWAVTVTESSGKFLKASQSALPPQQGCVPAAHTRQWLTMLKLHS